MDTITITFTKNQIDYLLKKLGELENTGDQDAKDIKCSIAQQVEE